MQITQEIINQIADNMLSIFPMLTKNVLKKDEFTEKYGLPPRFIHILHILDHFGPMSISEMSKRLSILAPNMTPLIDKLISEGYVKRSQAASDRRVSIIEITQKGKELTHLHTQWVNHNLKKHLQNLSDDEIEELWYVLKRLKKLVMKMIGCSHHKEDEEKDVKAF
ncbi:MarR family winged helix-turn-helix transcriptional regulator [Caldicellulosiruptor naganoensis]|uniref:MarR family transcriptional regulator n=1 Tax=Caldicellulosiruptor naganoensis TaxID=29324 RepID=A0ABY7BJ78_9FIRM|nr:MarR family transcriptional regulator [Caldicellulosiruptor naganoensis]WAM31785.1 MarR family transcriptional regulator [Caldicellulosiruptor naganoensis]